MSLQVTNVKTGFKDDGTVHPVVLNRRTWNFEDLVSAMNESTAIPKSDLLAVWENEVKTIKSFLKEGYRIQTPLGNFSLGIRKSVVAGEDDPDQIDSSGIHLIFHADDRLMDELRRETRIQVLDPNAPRSPVIMKVTNPRNADAPDSAHVGKVVNITGARLSFDSTDTECGAFFWNGGGREAAVRAGQYTHVGTSRVDVEVPDNLPVGEYNLEIRTRPTNKDVRLGVYQKKIKVETP